MSLGDIMKKFKKFLKWGCAIILTVAVLIFIAFQVSPWPSSLIIRQIFNQPVEITNPTLFDKAQAGVTLTEDVEYTSELGNNTLDIYAPSKSDTPHPVLLWVHGGGYVAGDKSSIVEFANYIADELQMAVVSVNYEVAPGSQYPNQLKQLEEAVQFLIDENATYPFLDMNQLVIGGDSAGAQIAGQYVALQTNSDYLDSLEMDQQLSDKQIKGFISYCGPLDLRQSATKHSDSAFMKFFIRTVAWSLIGEREWADAPELQEASILPFVTNDFPPSYITDGNTFSFEEQGIAFVEQLENFDVPVKSRFFTHTDQEIVHEYQFDYSTPEAMDSLEDTVQFLNLLL